MSGLEMMARGGRLVYVRQTISMDELERGRDEMTDHGAAKERPKRCPLPPEGWFCTRAIGHEGPCAAYPCYVPTAPLMWPDDPPQPLKQHWAYKVGTAMVVGAILIAIVAFICGFEGVGR